MNEKSSDKPPQRGDKPDDDARAKLAQNWAAMTASMVSPDAAAKRPLPGSKRRPSPAPLPVDPPDRDAPAEPAPSNVTPLPLPVPPQPARPATDPQQPAAQPTGAQAEPADAQPHDQTPPGDEPALAPAASPEPQLAPVGRPAQPQAPQAPLPAAGPQAVESLSGPTATRTSRERDEDPHNLLVESRNNMTIAVSFTIFALVVAMVMMLGSQYSTNPAGSDGSGTILATIAAIGVAWAIALGNRLLGRFWYVALIVPLAILLIGPMISGMLWLNNQEALAHSYLSPAGQTALIDADENTLASTAVSTPEGCFTFVRDRSTKETTVLAAGKQPGTARQHADMALAPRFAAHIPAGGAASAGHIFYFDGGNGPPRVETPDNPPLDCAGG
jgi:hypothetical protein